jgi:hypothetical protein
MSYVTQLSFYFIFLTVNSHSIIGEVPAQSVAEQLNLKVV